MSKNTPSEAMKSRGGRTDDGAHALPTPGSFGGLENREEVIAKPSINFGRRAEGSASSTSSSSFGLGAGADGVAALQLAGRGWGARRMSHHDELIELKAA